MSLLRNIGVSIWVFIDKRLVLSNKAQNCATLSQITNKSFDELYEQTD